MILSALWDACDEERVFKVARVRREEASERYLAAEQAAARARKRQGKGATRGRGAKSPPCVRTAWLHG